MSRYAEKTTVPVEKSRAEIETVVSKYGATQFGYLNEPGRAVIMFACQDRRIRFTLSFPLITEKQFQLDGRKKQRSGDQIFASWEQACRQKWRALLLSIKAKLESVSAGIAEFEEEFLPFIIDPETNQTIYEGIREPLAQKYVGNLTGPLLLTGPPA